MCSIFEAHDLLDLQLIFHFDELLDDTGEDPDYHDALMVFTDQQGKADTIEVELRARGSFRKNPVNCDFPPLKMKIDKDERRHTMFESNKEIKMVTHCQENKPEYEQYLFQEYLIYRTYNLFTEFSFQVRILHVTYIDAGGSGTILEKHAFFLEHDEEMADRLNGNLLEISTAKPSGVNQHHFSLVSFFEYMIINTDWSLPIMHNVALVSTDYFEPPYPVPFDFDWSGITNIPYVVPGVGNKSEQPRVRVFKGACRKRREFRKIIDLFNDKRLEIYQLYLDFEFLDEDYKQEIFKHYNDFYHIINSRELFRANIRQHCDIF